MEFDFACKRSLTYKKKYIAHHDTAVSTVGKLYSVFRL